MFLRESYDLKGIITKKLPGIRDFQLDSNPFSESH